MAAGRESGVTFYGNQYPGKLRAMPTQPDLERSCIGVLLARCRIAVIPCGRCWYSSGKGEPTLVKIAVFERIRNEGLAEATAA
jgi:hypothetical protein